MFTITIFYRSLFQEEDWW